MGLQAFVRQRISRNEGLSSVLVAVAGHECDEEAVKLAAHLLGGGRGTLHVVYVIEVSRALPVDAEIGPETARGNQLLLRMEEVVKPERREVRAALLQSRQAGFAVVQEAVEKGVDAIVLGVPYMEVRGEFSLGDTARYVLRNAPCKVVLWRDSVPAVPSLNGNRP
jgi:nucleotide-binding universal stress UspA family protein